MEDHKLQNKSVQTYAEDMARAIKSNEGGLIKKIIREQEEHEAQKKNLSPQSQRNRTFMVVSILLVILALGAIVFIVIFRQQFFTVMVAPRPTPIIFTDQNQFLEVGGLTKDKIAQIVLNKVQTTKVKVGGVEGIYLTNNKIALGFKGFLNSIKANIDQRKIVFVNDNFLMGVVNKQAKSFFILLKVRSFADVFEGIKSWENKMFYDMHGFFGMDISADTNYLLTKDFKDGVINNRNARILHDKDGKIVIAYVYANNTSLVITNTEEAVNEIMLRLSTGTVAK